MFNKLSGDTDTAGLGTTPGEPRSSNLGWLQCFASSRSQFCFFLDSGIGYGPVRGLRGTGAGAGSFLAVRTWCFHYSGLGSIPGWDY